MNFNLDYFKVNFEQNDAQVLLLVHGRESTKETWMPILPFLKKYCVYAIDLPGFGRSSCISEEEFSLTAVVNEVNNFAQNIIKRPFVVIGHSMGARIAITLAAKNPQLTKGLIIVDMELVPRKTMIKTSEQIEKLKAFQPLHNDIPSITQELDLFGWGSRTDSWLQQKRIIRREDQQKYCIGVDPYVDFLIQNRIMNSLESTEDFKSFKQINLPVLLIQADTDSSVTEDGVNEMTKLHPAMKVKKIQNSTHSVFKTQTQSFVAEVENFIANLPL